MKLNRIYVKNFRSIKEMEIFPKGMLVLVGENNAGKSNILRAINFVLGEGWPTDISKEDTFGYDESVEVMIQIDFELSREEHQELRQYRSEYADGKITGVRFHKLAKANQTSRRRTDNVTYRFLTDSRTPKKREEYPTAEGKQAIAITYLDANRDLKKHLGYGSRFTFMSRLANKFEQELDKLEKDSTKRNEKGLKSRIQQKFRDVEDLFREVEKFKRFDESLQRYFEDHLPEKMSGDDYDVSVSFKAYNPMSYFKSLNLVPRDEDKEIDLDQLGDGLKTILLLSYFKAYADAFRNGSVMLMEEPEIYLHPPLRRHIFDLFRQLTNEDNVQVIISTHSSDFVDVTEFWNIGIVRKESKETKLYQAICEDIQSTKTNDLLRHIKAYMCDLNSAEDPTIDSVKERLRVFYRQEQSDAFFSKKVVLVEGDSEYYALPIYARALGYSFNQEGIAIVNCGSKYNIPYFYSLFNKCFQIPTYVIFDGDKDRVNSIDPKRKQAPELNQALQKMLGIPAVKIIPDESITETYSIFEENFETFVRRQCFDYDTLAQAAKDTYKGKGEMKWFIQRYIAIETTNNSFFHDTAFDDLKSVLKKIFNVDGAAASGQVQDEYDVPF